jgi:hypothetical protein
MTMVSEDARCIPEAYRQTFSLAVTSPPYLNGTNYFRNTKLELWYLGFIHSERDLAEYRRRAITAGINNVSLSRRVEHSFGDVEKVATRLDLTAADRRIPQLVRQYFSDMFELFSAVHRALAPGGRFVMDIGDSKFYGVHVATDQLLIDGAVQAGFELEQETVIARRRSLDKSELIQAELVFMHRPT